MDAIECLRSLAKQVRYKSKNAEQLELNKQYYNIILKHLKAFQIINNKFVDMLLLKTCNTVKEYNDTIFINYKQELTSTEFKLLQSIIHL